MKFCKNITLNVKLLTNVGVFSYSFPDVICKDILTVSSFYNDPSEQVLSYSFNGETGLNKFTFSQYVQEDIFSFSLFKRDSDGNFMDTTGILELYPSLSGVKTGNFITGIQILNSGIYSGVPIVNFDSYSGVDSISVNQLNLISESAGDSFNLVFSGNGTGSSATAYTKKINIQLFSGENPTFKFRTITGVQVNSGGYGFNESYSVRIPDSITDYPKEYFDQIASSLGYAPVTFYTNFIETAGSASGVAILSSGLSGNLSGIIILGAGTGYKTGSIQFPKFKISRSDSDAFEANEIISPEIYKASGNCLLNSSGENMDFDQKFEFSYSRSLDGEYYPLSGFDANKKISQQFDFSENNRDIFLKIKAKNSTILADNFVNYNFRESGTNISGKSSFIRVKNNYKIEDYQTFDTLFGISGDLQIEE